MRPVRVLVVDDSATMRSIIARTLETDPDIKVVGRAADPLEARSAVKALDPDVITLDVEMPNMNGIDFLEKIMRLRPTPVIMVSNLTGAGAAATLKALEIGAFDCVEKPSAGDAAPFAELAAKVKAAADARRSPMFTAARTGRPTVPTATEAFQPNGRVVAIGSSTGGVEALLALIAEFPEKCPPTVITQHMPATFTRSFAERLNRITAATVAEAVDGEILRAGRIYIAPGGGTASRNRWVRAAALSSGCGRSCQRSSGRPWMSSSIRWRKPAAPRRWGSSSRGWDATGRMACATWRMPVPRRSARTRRHRWSTACPRSPSRRAAWVNSSPYRKLGRKS